MKQESGGAEDILACLIGDIDSSVVDLTCGEPNLEIKAYVTEPVPVHLQDPMQWWRSNESR